MALVDTKFYRLADGSVGKVRIVAEDHPADSNPRENESNGALLLTWERGYTSPDKPGELPAELDGAVNQWAGSDLIDAYRVARFARMTSAPVLYIGGLTRNGYDGAIGIDDSPADGAGYVGLAIVTPDTWRTIMGDAEPTPEAAREIAHREVKRYSEWVTGEVFGYIAETPDGTEVDDCWGYIGRDEFEYMFSQGADALGDGAQEITESEYDDAANASADTMHANPLVEVLAVLDRLESSGESFTLDTIRAHVPEAIRAQLAPEVEKLNAQLREAGY